MRRFTVLILVGLLTLAPALTPPSLRAEESRGGGYEHAVVASDHELASAAGVEMLERGGNVVDAAVATGFALSVLRPESSGIGGGGFMVIWNADAGEAIALDYRERAPKKATRDMFRPEGLSKEEHSRLSVTGHLATGVPGHVAGLCYALEHYGTLDLKTVLAPAIKYAEDGFPVDRVLRGAQAAAIARFEREPETRERYAAFHEQYLHGGKAPEVGAIVKSPQARVLRLIAEHGPDAFYKGPVAEAIVAESQRGGGLLTLDDLAAMKPVVREPLRGRYGKLAILTMPPPSSGGIALLETLNILSAYEAAHPDAKIDKLGPDDPLYLHLLTEAMKHAFADRAEFLGDADFVDVPVARLTSRAYAAELAKRIDPEKTKPLEAYGRFVPPRDGGTTHFSIVDADGNAVACTETINTGFGSYVVEPKYGILLNNEMDDFAAVPGQPNAFGLMQSEKNAVAPGKKPLSSMSPTIALEDGRAVYVVGASGGPRIISASLQVLLNMTRFGMTVEQAVHRPRIHHQWLPEVLDVEDSLWDKVHESLAARGHKLLKRSAGSACQAAHRAEAAVFGASDPRKNGKSRGY
ncbi:MAG: gamma-glutamyltransferase [Planctomycetaceae bacterium]